MQMNIDNAEKSSKLLEQVIEDKLKAKAALEQWPDIETEQGELIEAAWHDLSHYANDDDLRAADKEYENILKTNLSEKLKLIRNKYSLK